MSKEEDDQASSGTGNVAPILPETIPRNASAAAVGPSAARIEQINVAAGYKARFIRTKARYQRACEEQLEFSAGVKKAMAKQLKLQDEIDFLLDAILAANATRSAAAETSAPGADTKRPSSTEAADIEAKRQRTA